MQKPPGITRHDGLSISTSTRTWSRAVRMARNQAPTYPPPSASALASPPCLLPTADCGGRGNVSSDRTVLRLRIRSQRQTPLQSSLDTTESKPIHRLRRL